jgi:hypothetical protein
MNEISTDAIIVPTRGNDWYDGGKWVALWTHNFKPDYDIVNGAWSALNNGIGKVNFTLNVLKGLSSKPANYDAIVAELTVLRDYYIFMLTDMYGDVPVVEDYNTDPSKVVPQKRSDIYTLLVTELEANVPLLTKTKDKTTYGRLTQYAGYMLLAKVYLNAQVYTGTAQWAKASSTLDKVLAGGYALQGNYFDNFSPNNEGSLENIWVVPYDKVNIGGMNWEMQTLHYSHNKTYGLTNTPWNGFSSTADYLNKFEDADARKAMYLVGQQYDADGVTPLMDPQTGLSVVLDPNITTLSSTSDAFRLAGARNVKYHPEAGTAGNQSNDMVLFRLADAMLMKAEAELHLGNDGAALTLVNQVRQRAGVAALAALTPKDLLDERARELAWEGWRRNDMIRFEVAYNTPYFTAARTPGKVQDPDKHTFLFPIPSPQLITNPNLKQNPGY